VGSLNFLSLYESPQIISTSPAIVNPWNKTDASLVYMYEPSKPTKQRTQAAHFKGETTMQETLLSNSISNSSQTLRRFSTKTALAITLAITAMAIAATPAAEDARPDYYGG
jgi:hypothetical protein